MKFFALAVALVVIGCSAREPGQYTGTSNLICGHFHRAIPIGAHEMKALHGVINLKRIAQDSTPVENVVVYLKKSDIYKEKIITVASDSHGEFKTDLEIGTYRLETCRVGYSALIGTIEIREDGREESLTLLTDSEDTELSKRRKVFGVRVVDKD